MNYKLHLPESQVEELFREHDARTVNDKYMPRKTVWSWRDMNNIAYGMTKKERQARADEARAEPHLGRQREG